MLQRQLYRNLGEAAKAAQKSTSTSTSTFTKARARAKMVQVQVEDGKVRPGLHPGPGEPQASAVPVPG